MTGNSLIDRLGATTKNDKNSDELHKKNKEKQKKSKEEAEARMKEHNQNMEQSQSLIADMNATADSLHKSAIENPMNKTGLQHLTEMGGFKSVEELQAHLKNKEEELAKLKNSLD